MSNPKKFVDIPVSEYALETGTVNSDTDKKDEEIKFLRNRCRVYIDCDNATKLKDFLINLSNIRNIKNDILLLEPKQLQLHYIIYIYSYMIKLSYIIKQYTNIDKEYTNIDKDLLKKFLENEKKSMIKILYIINILLKVFTSNQIIDDIYKSIINDYIGVVLIGD